MAPPRASAPEPSAWRLPVAVALVSAAALGYQLLLMRWLAIAHWTPFAAMIISLALLGHGASGTWLCLCGEGARRRFGLLFPACALLFGLSAIQSVERHRAPCVRRVARCCSTRATCCCLPRWHRRSRWR